MCGCERVELYRGFGVSVTYTYVAIHKMCCSVLQYAAENIYVEI